MESQPNEVAETLMERLNKLVQPVDRPLEWGNPLSSVTPQSLAIQDLAARTGALETAVREIAYEVQKLTSASTETTAPPPRRSRTKLSARVGSSPRPPLGNPPRWVVPPFQACSPRARLAGGLRDRTSEPRVGCHYGAKCLLPRSYRPRAAFHG